MADLYPTDGHPYVEMKINGVWVDVSDRVRGDPRITITRGRANEQSNQSPQRCDFTINNRDGLFSNRNPNSAYYGRLLRNTQMRVWAGHDSNNYLHLPYNSGDLLDQARAEWHSSLNIAGDIEVVVEVDPYTWRPRYPMVLAARWMTDGQNWRSWVLVLTPQGNLRWVWSVDGSAISTPIDSNATIPATSGRLSIRAQFDINNGAGGKTITYATAPTLAGTYTTLGTAVTQAGTTSVYSGGQAHFTVGAGHNSANIFTGYMKGGGKFYQAQLKNGLGGTVVANANFTARTVDTTNWTDSVGRSWFIEVSGMGRIGSDRLRFWGEIASFPQSWDVTGRDVYVPMTATGASRRLTRGDRLLRSPLYRALSAQPTLTAYIPMEDEADSTLAASALASAPAANILEMNTGQISTLPGAERVFQFESNSSRIYGVTNRAGVPQTQYFQFYLNLSALPASHSVLMSVTMEGVARKFTLDVGPVSWRWNWYLSDGSTILDQFATNFGTFGSPLNQWIMVSFTFQQNGSNIDWTPRWQNVSRPNSVYYVSTRSFVGTLGKITSYELSPRYSPSYVGGQVGHFMSASANIVADEWEIAQAGNAYLGENATRRAERLVREEDVPVELFGALSESEPMGYQKPALLRTLLDECAEADVGMLVEARDFPGYQFYAHDALEHRRDLTLDYSASHLSRTPEATEDDALLANYVTVKRDSGSSAVREITQGFLSTSNIGRYELDSSVNIASDDRLDDIASFLANQGAQDEARYPNLTVGLHRPEVSNSLAADVLATNLGSTAFLCNLPDFLPPNDVWLMVQGYRETLWTKTHDFEFNTTPAAVWNTGIYNGDTEMTGAVARYGAQFQIMSSPPSGTTGTSITLLITSPDLAWTTDPASLPFDVMLGGERMTVTAIGAYSAGLQTITVTRSVNGIVKTHTGGFIQVYPTTRWGL